MEKRTNTGSGMLRRSYPYACGDPTENESVGFYGITDVSDLSDLLENYVLLSIEQLNTGSYEIVNWKELSERVE